VISGPRAADQDCLFCAIVHAGAPSFRVLSTEHVVAFLDVRPLFPGHVLVVPRQHVATLEDLPDRLVGPLFRAVREVTGAVRTGLGAGGAFVATNNRVSQSVAHLHVHVVPRTKGDGLRGFFWPRRRYTDEAEAISYAARISAALPD